MSLLMREERGGLALTTPLMQVQDQGSWGAQGQWLLARLSPQGRSQCEHIGGGGGYRCGACPRPLGGLWGSSMNECRGGGCLALPQRRLFMAYRSLHPLPHLP